MEKRQKAEAKRARRKERKLTENVDDEPDGGQNGPDVDGESDVTNEN